MKRWSWRGRVGPSKAELSFDCHVWVEACVISNREPLQTSVSNFLCELSSGSNGQLTGRFLRMLEKSRCHSENEKQGEIERPGNKMIRIWWLDFSRERGKKRLRFVVGVTWENGSTMNWGGKIRRNCRILNDYSLRWEVWARNWKLSYSSSLLNNILI